MSMGLKVSLVIFLFSIQSFAAADLKKALGCYKSLHSTSLGSGIYKLDDEKILIPGVKDTAHGFYIYTEKSSYFCDLPKTPSDSNGRYNYYFMNLKVPSKNPVHVTYSELKTDMTNSNIAIMVSAQEKEVPVQCNLYLTKKSSSLLTSKIESLVTSVNAAYNERKDYKGFAEHGESINTYRDSLKACKDVNKKITKLVEKEINKFPAEKTAASHKRAKSLK
jgi:hypothetical protein